MSRCYYADILCGNARSSRYRAKVIEPCTPLMSTGTCDRSCNGHVKTRYYERTEVFEWKLGRENRRMFSMYRLQRRFSVFKEITGDVVQDNVFQRKESSNKFIYI